MVIVSRALALPCAAAATWVAFLVLPACQDPVHDDLVRSLGPEAPGVPAGPRHRPGQPCLACHGGNGPASTVLSLGGTVYADPDGMQPSEGATVHIEDVNIVAQDLVTNAAGNFFVGPSIYTPTYPIRMKVTSADGNNTQQMLSLSLRSGSCADCHTNPPSPTSPGVVYLMPAMAGSPPADDGGSE
jgi:hypothetical protein